MRGQFAIVGQEKVIQASSGRVFRTRTARRFGRGPSGWRVMTRVKHGEDAPETDAAMSTRPEIIPARQMRLGRSVDLLPMPIGDFPSGMGTEIARECALGTSVSLERPAKHGSEGAAAGEEEKHRLGGLCW